MTSLDPKSIAEMSARFSGVLLGSRCIRVRRCTPGTQRHDRPPPGVDRPLPGQCRHR